jgi:hypothetical protein
MKRSLLALFFASSLSTMCFAADQVLTLDTPLHFNSADEIIAMAVRPPEEVHPQIGEALTYLTTYVPQRDTPRDLRDALMLSLCEGRTPRQLLVLGFVLRLEILKSALAEDQLSIATRRPLRKGETFEDSRTLYEIRISRCHVEIESAQILIRDLLKREPNSERSDSP